MTNEQEAKSLYDAHGLAASQVLVDRITEALKVGDDVEALRLDDTLRALESMFSSIRE